MCKKVVMWALLGLLLSAPAFAGRGGLVYHEVQIRDELGRPVTDITTVTVYAPSTTSAATIYKDRARNDAITQAMTTSSTNTTLSNGSFYWWGPDGWDYTISDGTNTHTNGGHNSLTASDSYLIFPSYLQSISSTTYTDAQTATFGTGADFVLQGGATADRFTVTPTTTDETPDWYFGANTTGMDVRFFPATSADYMEWDADAEVLEFVGTSIGLDDDSDIFFGSGDDWSMTSDTAKHLDILPLTGDESYILNVGADSAGADVYFFAATSGDYFLWDASDEAVEIVGGNLQVDDGNIALDDGDQLLFGTTLGTGDFSISDESDVLLITQVADGTGEVAFSADGEGMDITFYTDTASSYIKIDENGQTNGSMVFEATDLHMMDGDFIIFGDGSDFTIDSSTAKQLDIVGANTDETDAVHIGVDSAGIDLSLHGATASDILLWDASEDYLHMIGDKVLFTLAEAAAANVFKVDCTGASGDTDVIQLETTDGGIMLLADGDTEGDISLDAEDDITITAAGDLVLAVTGTFDAGGAMLDNLQITTEVVSGTTDELTAAQSGNIIIYTQTGGACTVTLPELTAAGLWYILVDADPVAGEDLVIDPEGDGTINGDTAGNSITCATDIDGQAILICGTAADTWYAILLGGSAAWTEE